MARTDYPLRTGLIALMILFSARSISLHAGTDKEFRIPKPGQPTSDFYNAAGTEVKLTFDASPTELTREEWITLRLTITNLINGPDVQKPSLKALPAFNRFRIEEGPELDPKVDPAVRDRRVFVYRLQPLSEKTSQIPAIDFYYFDPIRKVSEKFPQHRFPRRSSNSIDIRVRPPAAPPQAAVVPLSVPDFAMNLGATDEPITTPPPKWVWLLALLTPPIIAIGWIVVWRRLYPDAAKLAQLKRNRSVRLALAALESAKTMQPVEAAGMVSNALLAYLHERFELPAGAFTPTEIAAHMGTTACHAERIERLEKLLRLCDDQRFAPMYLQSKPLAAEAEQLVIALEEPA